MDNKLSLIIPIYNAGAFISDTLLRLTEWKQKTSYPVQIILINDGSSDSTHSIVENYIRTIDPSIEMISYKTNQGKGHAVKTGILAATGKYRIFTDADIPFGFEILDNMLYYLDFKKFDVVIGDRTLPGSSYFTDIPQIRKIGSDIFSFIVGRFVAGGYIDTQCGIKGFRDTVANDLFSVSRINGFAFDVELLYISLKRNYDIKRLPVVLSRQESSSVNILRHGIGMFIDLWKIKWNQTRGKYKNNYIIQTAVLNKFPKKIVELPTEFRKIHNEHYLCNREGKYVTSSLSQRLEAWMHKKVAEDVANKGKKLSTLEIGAGTLNQLPYEPAQEAYDIVEPFKDLFEGSALLNNIRKIYNDINEIDNIKYDRITSIATFEHIADLPSVVAKAALLLDEKDGHLRIAIPNEGTIMWRLGTMLTGYEFKKKYGLDYQIMMRYLHVNTAEDIENILNYFFENIECSVLGINKSLAFYRFYDCTKPNLNRVNAYLKRISTP